MTRYVVGFLFNQERTSVVLIRKTHPEWQAGKLNGVGGYIDKGERSENTMIREAKEEMGVTGTVWFEFAELTDNKRFSVIFYYAVNGAAFHAAHTTTDEEVVKVPIHALYNPDFLSSLIKEGRIPSLEGIGILPNVPWLVAMALSFYHGENARSFYIKEQY